jgi:hypothetical protein
MVDHASVETAQGHGGPPPGRPVIQIVPLRGLPIVGVAVIFVVVAIATNSLWMLTLCHVAGGGIWTALDLFVGLVLGPIIGSMSIQGRAEFMAKFMPKMVLIMPTVVLMTLAAGLQIALNLGDLSPASPNHAWLVASFIIVGIMAVIALGVLEPANVAVLFEMRKERPNGAIIEKLMKRFMVTAGITGLLQVATLVIMTRVATQ